MKHHKLSSGYEIPEIGLGTWEVEDEKDLMHVFDVAYETGYRHIDTAHYYKNEHIIGKWLKTKPRDELFITTKLWNTDHDRVAEACQESLEKLCVDYIDLYLIHCPVNQNGEFNVEKLWKDMEKLVEEKKVRSIGCANFGIKNLTKILSFCKIKPAVLQVELHPYLPQDELREFCKNKGIQVISYSSLGSSAKDNSVKDEPIIKEIAEKHKVCPSTILLSFCIALDCCIIPRSMNPEHVKSNFKTIKLDEEDMKRIESIEKRFRYMDMPSMGPNRFD